MISSGPTLPPKVTLHCNVTEYDGFLRASLTDHVTVVYDDLSLPRVSVQEAE